MESPRVITMLTARLPLPDSPLCISHVFAATVSITRFPAPTGRWKPRSHHRSGSRFSTEEVRMKHRDQVLALLQTQIRNAEEVSDISTTADEVAQKWVNPVSGGK